MSKDTILLDYYDGAYGPTIRIYTKSRAALKKLKSTFLHLSSCLEATVNLAAIEGVNALTLNSLIIRGSSEVEGFKKKLIRVTKNKSKEIAFEWLITPQGCEKIADLVDGLLEHNLPGHQYLTQEGIDDAIVELSFKE
jgi:hypothetical protein